VIIHNWESGLDASPAYDPAFHTHITSLNQSAWLHLYPKFWELVETYKLGYKWNVTAILERESAPNSDKDGRLDTWFVVKDLAVNSVYAAGWAVLADLARELGDRGTAADCDSEYALTRDGILKKMWSEEQGHFQTLYVDSDGVEKFAAADTVQNLFPLLLRDLPADRVEEIVAKLQDPKQFNAPMGIPTVSMSDPQFEPTFPVDLMWRGPVWGFTNWFVMEGLGLHQQEALQKEIFNKWIGLVQLSGIYEHYNPYTGAPYGTEGLGMSTLVCDWIYRYGLVEGTNSGQKSSTDDTDDAGGHNDMS
jgi:glucosylglycerate hydrolase